MSPTPEPVAKPVASAAADVSSRGQLKEVLDMSPQDAEDPEAGHHVVKKLQRQLSATGILLPELPPNFAPALTSYLMGYFSSMHAIIGTVLTMYIAVIAQVAANAANTKDGAANAPITWKLIWVLDLVYPIVIAAAVLWVAWEVELRRFFFFELVQNGYLISFEASHCEIWTKNYWLRPNFGYFPHIALIATAMLAVSTHAALSALSVVVIQLFSLFLFYGGLIDMERTTPPIGIFVAKHRFFLDKDGKPSDDDDFKADSPSKYTSKEAITHACESMQRLTVLNEDDIRKDIRSMMLSPDGWLADDHLINAFGDGGALPMGLMNLAEPPDSFLHRAGNFMLNMMTGGMWGRVWATKIVLTLILANVLKLKPFTKTLASSSTTKRLPFYYKMWYSAWVAFFAVLCIEIYGIYVGVHATQQTPPPPPPGQLPSG